MADILCAGNAIKEVMSAGRCLSALESGVKGSTGWTGSSFLISDGGNGFLEACGRERYWQQKLISSTGPLGDKINVPILFDPKDKTAYIESALCSGLALIEPSRRNIMISGTAGVADLLVAAREAGAAKVYLGLGGSATCDGGAGFLWRLAELSGQCPQGTPHSRVDIDLPQQPSPNIAALMKWLEPLKIIGCADVNNPLLGSRGTARVFASQKGADTKQTEQLEGWMGQWCERVERNIGMQLREMPGTGAAGGLGFAVAAVGGCLSPGARMVFELTGLPAALKAGMTLITAEGKFDQTSLSGKATWEAALLAREQGAQAVIFCGISDEAAIVEAKRRGIKVIEYGRGLRENQRASLSPGRLTDAVTVYLRDGSSNTE